MKQLQAVLTDRDSFATTLLTLAVDALGFPQGEWDPEFLDWHPETIKQSLEHEFSVEMPKLNFDRLMAGICIISTDLFFQKASSFIPLANVLAGDDFQPGVFERADSLECAWAVTEALLLHPPTEEDPEPFSDEVRKYIGAVLLDEGFTQPPDILRIAIPPNFLNAVDYDYSDDPGMFQAMYQSQQSKAAEVEDVIRGSLQDLLQQLRLLPLRHGETAELETRLRKAIGAKSQ